MIEKGSNLSAREDSQESQFLVRKPWLHNLKGFCEAVTDQIQRRLVKSQRLRGCRNLQMDSTRSHLDYQITACRQRPPEVAEGDNTLVMRSS
jgi:hypothetical protein